MSERYIVRGLQDKSERGSDLWGVYDTETSSWPAVIDGKRIASYTTNRAEAERDAQWLNQLKER